MSTPETRTSEASRLAKSGSPRMRKPVSLGRPHAFGTFSNSSTANASTSVSS